MSDESRETPADRASEIPASSPSDDAASPPGTAAREPVHMAEESSPRGRDQPAPKRSGGWIAVVLALLALTAAGYAIYRIEDVRTRFGLVGETVESIEEAVRSIDTAQTALRGELADLSQQQAASIRELETAIAALQRLPAEVEALGSRVADLRARSDPPQRAWARAEALLLTQLAQRRLELEHDVATAIVALESAAGALSELDDPGFAAARAQIERDIDALASVPQPDRAALAARLTRAAADAGELALAAPVAGESRSVDSDPLPADGWERAWAMVRNTFADLVTVRRTTADDAIVSTDVAGIRRQHLELLLFSARLALSRADRSAFVSHLASARDWLDRHFNARDPDVAQLRDELDALAQIDVAPPLPSLADAVRLLENTTIADTGAPR